MDKIIEIHELKKSYGKCKAVDGIDLYIGKGQTYALLGPNGAGKSTTLNILCTLTDADEGLITIDGLTPEYQNSEIRKRIGVVFQNGVLDDLLTVEENLYFRGSFYSLQGKLLLNRIHQIAEMTGITDLLNRPYGCLSGGQRRRCDIARALLHHPKILFLDEPTTGLDPEIRSAVWETINKIKAENHMTVLLTTHYMEEAASADYIAIMKNGKIAASGTPSILKDHFSKDSLILFSENPETLRSMLGRKGVNCRQNQKALEVPLPRTLDALALLDFCKGCYSGFEVSRGNMDDAYLAVIGDGASHAYI